MTNKHKESILIATRNPGKAEELRLMLADFEASVLSLVDFPEIMEVAETGSTFAENAQLKAAAYARQTRLTAIADDSGLEIEVLNGRPGVLSARYGGIGTSFESKMALLLEEIARSGSNSRQARFVSSIAVASPEGDRLYQAEGVCEGEIASKPAGSGGFGYDPIFIPDGYDMTFGELDAAIKHEISHRSRAFRSIIPFLRDFIAN